MAEEKKKIDLLNVMMLFTAFITVYLQIFPPMSSEQKIISLVFFITILFYIGSIYIVNNYNSEIRNSINLIKKHEIEIEEMKKKMETENRIVQVEKKVAVLEALLSNKKGELNTKSKIVAMAILLVLLYFYLRSMGLVP